jgi:hypothetical protein
MATIRTRLHPFSDVSEHDKISLYSLDQTGLAGQLVKIATGSANPQSTETDAFSATAVGVSYNGTYSNRYETKWKVTPTASGDTRYVALGFTELSTLEYDENGMPLKYNAQRAKEIGAVVSGETVPIIKKAGIFGIWGNYIDSSMGAVQPGNLVVVSRSGAGYVGSVDPSVAANFRAVSNTGSATNPFIYDDRSVIGKWLSSLPTSTNTGIASEFSAQGGYAFFTFDLSR